MTVRPHACRRSGATLATPATRETARRPHLARRAALVATTALTLLLAACGGGGQDRSDVVVTGTATAGPVPSDSEIEFRVVIANQGPDAAYNLSIEQTLDERLTLVDIRCEATAATCPTTPALTTAVSTLSAGSTLTFTVRATAPLGLAGSVTHRAVVRDVSSDTDVTNNNVTLPVVVGNADLSVVYSAPAEAAAGEPAVFTATVVNLGNAPATASTLDYTVPEGTTPGALSCEASGGATCPADLSARPLAVGAWPTGGRLRLRLPFTPPAELRGAITSRFLAATATDSLADNDSAEATSTVITPPANLSATLTAPTAVRPGAPLVFTARVTNGGPNPATGVQFDFTPPAGSTATVTDCAASAGVTCPASLSNSLALASLPASGFLQVRYSVTADTTAGTPMTAQLTVSGNGDPAVDNNVAQAQSTVRDEVANVTVAQSAPAVTVVGATAVFTADVGNDGPHTASAVRLAYTVSPAMPGAVLSCEATGGAACPASLADLSALDIAALPSGGSLRLLLSVPTSGLAIGATLSATLAAAYAGDPFAADSTATASTTMVVTAGVR